MVDMIQSPTPVTKTKTKGAKIATSTPLKRDINLISNREAQEKIARRGLITIAALVFLGGFAYFAFYMPLLAGNLLEAKLQDVNRQLAAYSKTDEEFTNLTTQVNNLQTMVDSVATSKSTSKSGYDYLKMIESACPKTLFLTEIDFNVNNVTLTGMTDKDSDVAQLVVNMQSYPDFSLVTVSSVTPVEVPSEVLVATSAQTSSLRKFVVVASFPAPEPTAQNGGSGQ